MLGQIAGRVNDCNIMYHYATSTRLGVAELSVQQSMDCLPEIINSSLEYFCRDDALADPNNL